MSKAEENVISLEAAKLLHEVLSGTDKYRVEIDLNFISGLKRLDLYAKGEQIDFNLSFSSDQLGSDTITFDKNMGTSLTPEGVLILENDSGEFIQLRIWQAFSIHKMPEFEVFNI